MTKNVKKFILYFIISFIISLLYMQIFVQAANKNSNLETMSVLEKNSKVTEILYSIINKDTKYIEDNKDMFTEEAYNKIVDLAINNDINGQGVMSITIDEINPNNSSTKDTVILVNTKIGYENGKYNKLYLLEIHINKLGMIYGYNIWVY